MAVMLRTLEELRPLRDPVFLAGFVSQFSGSSSAAAVEYLVQEWYARPVAELDPDECFDYTVRRPIVREVEGQRRVDWPLNRIYVASPPGTTRDFILLPGIEPHIQWRAFVGAIAEALDALGCRTAVLLTARRGGVPHTRPAPLRLLAEGASALGGLSGLAPSTSSYEGPVGIHTVLAAGLAAEGIFTSSLSALTPTYVPAEPNPTGVLALVQAVDAAFGTATPRQGLEDAKAQLDDATDEAVRSTPQLAATVEALEQQYDWIRGAPSPKATAAGDGSDLPSATELVAELERFLRSGSGRGGDGTRSV